TSHRPGHPPPLAVPRNLRPSAERLRPLGLGDWASLARHSTPDAWRRHRADLLHFRHPGLANWSSVVRLVHAGVARNPGPDRPTLPVWALRIRRIDTDRTLRYPAASTT